MKNFIIFLIASNVFALLFTGILHIFVKIKEKKFESVNYLASMILVCIVVIIYELLFEPAVERIVSLIELIW